MPDSSAEKIKYKILVVDDEKKVLVVARKVLRNAGYEVDICDSPLEALEIVANNGPIAVVITDNRMPHMRGTELLEKIKNISSNTVRVLTTAFYDNQLVSDAVNRGQVFRFLKKPLDFRQTLKVLEESTQQYEINVKAESLNSSIQRLTVKNNELSDQSEKLFSNIQKLQRSKKILMALFISTIIVALGFNVVKELIPNKELEEVYATAGEWIIYENGLALDTSNNLMWMVEDFRNLEKRNPVSWKEAMDWPKKINARRLGGYKNWRVPTIAELKKTFDPDRTHLAFDKNRDYPVGYPKAFAEGGGYGYWSSDSIGDRSAKYFFYVGGYDKIEKMDYNSSAMSVRLVRSTQ